MAENQKEIEKRIEPYYIDLLTILIKYKFADFGTAESNADEISELFMRYKDEL